MAFAVSSRHWLTTGLHYYLRSPECALSCPSPSVFPRSQVQFALRTNRVRLICCYLCACVCVCVCVCVMMYRYWCLASCNLNFCVVAQITASFTACGHNITVTSVQRLELHFKFNPLEPVQSYFTGILSLSFKTVHCMPT